MDKGKAGKGRGAGEGEEQEKELRQGHREERERQEWGREETQWALGGRPAAAERCLAPLAVPQVFWMNEETGKQPVRKRD